MLLLGGQDRNPVCIKRKPAEKSCRGDLTVEVNKRKQNVKRRAFFQFAFHFDLAAMFLNDSMHNRQTQPGAVIFGGEKRIEYVRNIFTANSFATIANSDPKNLVRFAVRTRDRGNPFLTSPYLTSVVTVRSPPFFIASMALIKKLRKTCSS